MTEHEAELSRRDLLRHAAQGAVLLGTGGLLGACSSSTKDPRRHDNEGDQGDSCSPHPAGRYGPA